MTQAPPPGPGAAPADEQRTVVEAPPSPGAALPVGQALQEFVIEGLVGEGGFGIVYLARDTRLDRVVALKEYMPTNLAQRGGDRSVSVRSERYRETFVLGLRSFVNEAKLLASFDHPSLVKVYRFWEENGTAYMVMPFYEGPTLRQKLAEFGQPPDEAWLRALLAPLIDALELIHNDHCWHRDIAPDNILLLAPLKTQTGPGPHLRPLLLDFGAARRVIGDVTHNLTVILKPGYAPLEQYAESAAMRQGPWTDVYALCAVLYCAVTGRAPVPSVSRVISDEMVSAVQAGAGRYSQAFLSAIDAGLAVRPDARPQTMAALRESFHPGRARAPQGVDLPRGPLAAQASPDRPGTAARMADVGVGAGNGAPPAQPLGKAKVSGDARNRSSAGGAQKWPAVLAGFAVLAVAGAALGWFLQRSNAPHRPPPVSPSVAQPDVAPQAPPGVAASAATVAPTAAPELAGSAAAPSAAPAPTAVPAALPAPPPAALPAPIPAPATASASAPAPKATARPAASRPPPPVAPAHTPPAPPVVAEPAPLAKPSAPAQPALDPKRFECEVLVRAGQKALANRSYDDAMQRADEALAVYPNCAGAADLSHSARQAKDRARNSAVIQ